MLNRVCGRVQVCVGTLLGSGHAVSSNLPRTVGGWDPLLGSHVRVLGEVPTGIDVESPLGSCLQGKAEREVMRGAVSLLGSSVPVMVCWRFMVSLLGSGHNVL